MNPSTSTGGVLFPRPAGFELTLYDPSPELAPFVERHWIVRWDLTDGEPFDQQLVPHPCVNVVVEDHLTAIHGIVTRRSSKRLVGRGRAVGTKFRPGGFRPFWGRPVRELNDQAVELEALFGAAAHDLARDVLGTADSADAVACMDEFFRARAPVPDPALAIVVQAARAVLEDDTLLRVSQLSTMLDVSLPTLRRLFREYVGVGPKTMIRRAQIHRAADALASGHEVDMSRLAADLGYYDQAHFIHTFEAEVGYSPGDYRRRAQVASARSAESASR